MKKKLQRLGAALAFALMALGAWLWWGPGPLKQDTRVVIPEGSSLSSATNYLYYARAISGPRNVFYYLARLLGEGDPVQAGEFEIPAAQGVWVGANSELDNCLVIRTYLER